MIQRKLEWLGEDDHRLLTAACVQGHEFDAALMASGQVDGTIGNQGVASWMGVPLMVGEQIFGVLIVQSYDPQVLYTQADLDVLGFMASHTAVAIARTRADMAIRRAKVELEEQNSALAAALNQLQDAQSELVRQEKLASLGISVLGGVMIGEKVESYGHAVHYPKT